MLANGSIACLRWNSSVLQGGHDLRNGGSTRPCTPVLQDKILQKIKNCCHASLCLKIRVPESVSNMEVQGRVTVVK